MTRVTDMAGQLIRDGFYFDTASREMGYAHRDEGNNIIFENHLGMPIISDDPEVQDRFLSGLVRVKAPLRTAEYVKSLNKEKK